MSLTVFILIPAICFIGGFFSTLAGLGGGLFTLASTSLFLPVSVVVPLNGVLILAGQVTRVVQFYRYIDWSITLPFIPGSIVGAAVGTVIYFAMPETLLAFLLACVLLWFCWARPSAGVLRVAARIPAPYFWVGVAHTFLSTVSGAGVLFQSMMVNSKLTKEGIVATIAGTLLFMALFKSLGYLAAGFDYTPYLKVIALSWVMGIAGTMLGKRCLDVLPDRYFRIMIRTVITLFALRLYWQVWQNLASS
ncbi:MAG TPA: sulfite exporter TauE/SafE family protein [Hyphomicrobiales bacterium]|nr:sulfite exporter TauE/SafE family protein [Hyphomicrobiales bacterium]